MKFVSNSASSRRISGQRPGAFAVAVTKVMRTTNPGSVSTNTVADRIYAHSEGTTRVTDYQVTAYLTGRALPGASFSFTSSNPSVATVSSSGLVSHVSNGTATITASYGGVDIASPLTLSTSVGVVTDSLSDFVSGSLGKNIWSGTNGLLTGATAGIATQTLFPNLTPDHKLYLPADEAVENFSRNPSLWASGVDFTCVPARLQLDGCQHGGVLVTPRHVLFPHHWNPFYQQNIYFVTQDGTVIRRRLMDKRQAGYGYPDLTPYELDADLPPSIKPAKILPDSFASKLTLDGIGLPAVSVRNLFASGGYQNGRFLVATSLVRLDHMPTPPWAGGDRPHMFQFKDSGNPPLVSPFFHPGWQGDSGSPCFVFINGEAVYIGSHLYSDSGDMVGFFQTDLNARLASLSTYGPTYSLTPYDLSAFPNYS